MPSTHPRSDGRRAPRWSFGLLMGAWLLAAGAHAYDSLHTRLPREGSWAELFGETDAQAEVKDGRLMGFGRERTELLPSGNLRVTRSKTYRRVVHPESDRVVRLRKPWRVNAVLELSPSLRLLSADTKLRFDREADEAIRDELERLFEWDRSRVVANARGDRLTRTLTLAGAQVERERYDYERDDIPLEIVGLTLAVAVKRRVERFDFDLLVPGGSTHGVRSRIHRVRSAKRFARGYPVPRERLEGDEALAVVEMGLASPVKRLLFPHKFYMVYSERDPAKLLAVWGGDPDENLQAFRID